MHLPAGRTRCALLMALAVSLLPAQESDLAGLVTTGQITVSGRPIPYRIRHLPVSSFPDLPAGIAAQLTERDCLIPQTYEAHQPENVVHASLERAGSSDWAVLCSNGGTVSLMVFFESAPAQPAVLVRQPETLRLQAHPSSPVLGFNWGIDPVSASAVQQAQIGMSPRPARIDHDALADSVIDHTTIYHYYAKGAWSLLDMPR